MHPFLTLSAADRLPKPHDHARAERGLDDWRTACAQIEDETLAAFAENAESRRILAGLFGNSPYLGRLLIRHCEFAGEILRNGPEAAFKRALSEARAAGTADAQPEPLDDLKRRLRIAKAHAALAIAIGDLFDRWPLMKVTGALSEFAECALSSAVNGLFASAAANGDYEPHDPAEPGDASGYIVLGMGKLGARELNFSSDIDLIILFDPEIAPYRGRRDIHDFFSRFTRTLAGVMQEFTGDGYVFRVDLRLRPDASVTPVALPVEAAESYYESIGQNWERAAMIKARPVAGDRVAAKTFLANIEPFVWRRNLDYAAVRDIQAMTRLIRSHHGFTKIDIPGHDVKLGIGGIREIEFFVQTHQLIAGGRERRLREPTTLGLLEILGDEGRIDEDEARDLADAYKFLRTVEHRVQMVNDEQTHELPETADGIARIANFMGYEAIGEWRSELTGHLERVQGLYSELLREAAGVSHGAEAPFELAGDDARLEDALRAADFADPPNAAALMRDWNKTRYRALRNEHARDLMEALAPRIVDAMGKTAEPDRALKRFDEFLGRLPAGIQLLSLLSANAWLLDLLAEVMGSSPKLASTLGHNPSLLDAVLTQGFLDQPPTRSELEEEINDLLTGARDFQDVLDLTRRFANDQKFRVGVQLLRHSIDGGAAGYAMSDIADAALTALLPKVREEFERHHGRVADCGMAIVAMGKLGAREMTMTSDLDLVFVYDDPPADARSDGRKPIPASQYFARLSQRFINAVTALTPAGILYEIDMRLRPSGNQGPLAVAFDGFRKYQSENAWNWERMALTRARAVTGPEPLCEKIRETVVASVGRRADRAKIATDASDMRRRIDQQYHTDNPWDVKNIRGGLIDAEFIAQTLILSHANAHPETITGNTVDALRRLGDCGALEAEDADALIEHTSLLRDVQQILRLCLDGPFDEKEAPQALKNSLARLANADTIDNLKDALVTAQEGVLQAYIQLVEEPAGDAAETTAKGD